MLRLSIREIIERIKRRETFEATDTDQSFTIKINRYVPYVCTAIHDGHKLRDELKEKSLLSDFERWYEEDPFTGSFIDSLPITLIGLDSRYEYDLNRRPEESIPEEAWGKKLWKSKLTARDRKISITKHNNFYKVVYALVDKLSSEYQSCLVYDMHSYNHQRWDREVPLFNIGAERVDRKIFGDIIEHWRQELGQIDINGVENQSLINDVFYGRGYNLEFITKNFPNVLVLATEVKKVYCDESSGEEYPRIIRQLREQIKTAVVNNSEKYSQEFTSWDHRKKPTMLDKKTDPELLKIDKKMYKMLKNFELLASVNPNNVGSEYRSFVRSKYTRTPEFTYNPVKVNAYELKQELSSLPTREITDVSQRNLYEGVIGAYFDKIDLLASLNTEKFLYNSMRYFGRPSSQDLENAKYILLLPQISTEPKRMPTLPIERVKEEFEKSIASYGLNAQVKLSNKIVAQVMVLNSKRTVLIKSGASFTRKELNALLEHEIGVHMVTTENSSEQKLKILNLGLPVNTLTQEGLAIMSEYLSGNITLGRLKKLALRVIVTDMMCNGASFNECFNYLTADQGVATYDAFVITTRIFRGGGFTKDYLYLRGFATLLKWQSKDVDLTPLLVGKTSVDYYDTLVEMIERGMLKAPAHMTKSLIDDGERPFHPIVEYIISGLK